MAEPDATGPVPDEHADPRPKPPRPLTIAAAIRQMQRQAAPIEAEIARAAEFGRRIAGEFGLEDSDAAPPAVEAPTPRVPVQALAASPAPERWKPPASTDSEIAAGWALYERRDAPAWLVERVREWWRPFEPGVVEHWMRLEREIKNLRHELGTDRRSHEEFHNARLRWSAEDLVAYMEHIHLIPKRSPPASSGRPRKRVADLDVHQWIAAQLAADPAFRYLSQKAASDRGPWGARTIGNSPVWKAMKAGLNAEEAAKAEQSRAEFEGRLGEDEDNIGMRVGRKSGLGRQRTSPDDRDHDRAAEDFIREAEANRKAKKNRSK